MIEFFDIVEKLPGYCVSKNGRILDPSDKFPRIYTDSLGYKYIKVRGPSYKKCIDVLVHQIVAETFIPNPNNYSKINHKDGNKSNNNVSNLEWIDDNIPNLPAEIWHKILAQNPININFFLVNKFLRDIIIEHIFPHKYKKLAPSDFYKFRDKSCNNLSHVVEEIFIDDACKITDLGLKLMTKIHSLILLDSKTITNTSVSNLRFLNKLVLIGETPSVTDLCLPKLKALTSLHLINNTTITSNGIKNLTQLKCLVLNNAALIENHGLHKLINLSELDLAFNNKITTAGISKLSNLLTLSLCNNTKIKDISMLTSLTNLNLTNNEEIYGDQLPSLTNLTTLNVDLYPFIRDHHLLHLTNLTELDLGFNMFVTSSGITQLKKLKLLKLDKKNTYVNLGELTCMKSLVIDVNNKY